MKTRLYFNVICAFVFSFTSSAFSQPVATALHGAWISAGGESTLVFNSKEVKFIEPPDNKEFILSWINSPPKDGTSPEAKVSVDGEYNVCFYRDSIITRKKLLISLAYEKDQERSTKIRSRESLNYEISINKWLKLINSLSSERFKVIECTEYVYSKASKNYELLGSGDGDVFFFYDNNKVYRWSGNLAVGGIDVKTYSRR